MVGREELQLKADKCRSIINQYSFLIDLPLVSFIVDNHWKYIEDLGWSDYLLSLPASQLPLIPDPKTFPVTSDTPQSLAKLVTDCLDTYGSFPMVDLAMPEGFVKLGMSPKKQHEVFRMGHFIAQSIAKSRDISQVIDFGSGKGLSLIHI